MIQENRQQYSRGSLVTMSKCKKVIPYHPFKTDHWLLLYREGKYRLTTTEQEIEPTPITVDSMRYIVFHQIAVDMEAIGFSIWHSPTWRILSAEYRLKIVIWSNGNIDIVLQFQLLYPAILQSTGSKWITMCTLPTEAKYLHQLQDLFFSLSGEQLEYSAQVNTVEP
jgi:hypothetical protein